MNSPARSVQDLEGLEIGEVLLGDPLDRDVVNIHLIALDEVEKQVERPLEDL